MKYVSIAYYMIKELTKKRDFLQDELRDIEQEIINLEKLLHEPTRGWW